MSNGKISIDINNEESFRGYVVSRLENITEKVEKTDTKVEELHNKVGKLENSNTSIEKIKKTLYGNGNEGLVIEFKKLALSHKIKSGFYGVLGGGGMVAIITLMYFLAKGNI